MEAIKVHRRHHKKRSEHEIISLLNKYSRLNINAITFCKKHDLVKGTFYTWKKKYQDQVNAADKAMGFVPLTISAPDQRADHEEGLLFAEVSAENGKSIKLFQQMPAAYLKELIG